MPADAATSDWDSDLADFLDELSDVQTELLDVLQAKRDCMASSDTQQMNELYPRTEELCSRLKACHDRRQAMLADAEKQGLPSASLGELATALPNQKRQQVTRQVNSASSQMRLLQHHSLTNWVLAQRTVLHLSQMLEIIATGGRLEPTYSRDESSGSPGALVDEEV